jgi:hypothetical protein
MLLNIDTIRATPASDGAKLKVEMGGNVRIHGFLFLGSLKKGRPHKKESKDRFKKVSPLTRMHSLEPIEEAKG